MSDQSKARTKTVALVGLDIFSDLNYSISVENKFMEELSANLEKMGLKVEIFSQEEVHERLDSNQAKSSIDIIVGDTKKLTKNIPNLANHYTLIHATKENDKDYGLVTYLASHKGHVSAEQTTEHEILKATHPLNFRFHIEDTVKDALSHIKTHSMGLAA